MADSALEKSTIVSPSCRAKAKDAIALNSSGNIKTPGSLRIPKRVTDGVLATSCVLDNQAASITKTTADSDKRKKSKMAVEARSSSRVVCEKIASASCSATHEMSANEQFDHGQRRHLKTVLDEKKRRRSDRYDSSESSDRLVNQFRNLKFHLFLFFDLCPLFIVEKICGSASHYKCLKPLNGGQAQHYPSVIYNFG